jgi:hypothetical protein
MRSTALVTGLAVGALGIGGAATASAAPLPITLTFGTGSVKLGNLPAAGASGTFVGTIESETLVATFPAGGVTFPGATVTTPSLGDVKVTPKATGTITGNPNLTTFTLDLSGGIAYDVTKGSDTCTLTPPTATTLAGSAIGADGAYSVSGSVVNPPLGPTPVLTPFCLQAAAAIGPVSSTALALQGKLAIPGVIPAPAAPATTTPTTPTKPPTTTTPATTTPAPAPKPGKLTLTVSRPKTVTRGRSTVTKVVLRNTGAGTARGVTVKLTAAKGVTPRSVTKTYATIGAGKTRTFSVRLRTTRTTGKTRTVKVTAKGASGLSASKSTTLRLR